MKNAKKILIIKPSSLGDVVHGLPFLHSVRKCFPKAEIHWVISRGLHELLEGHPMIDKLWIINKDQWKNISRAKDTVKEIKALFGDLKKERFDIAVDLQGLLRSGLITMATGAKVRVGFSEAREGSRLFYTNKVAGGKDVHAVDRYLKIASFLGCDVSEVKFPLPFSENFSLPFCGPYAVLVPGARWKTKRWPAEKFGELAALLPVKSVVIGVKADEGISETVVSLSGGKAVSLAGKTGLKELAGIIKNSRFMVTNDSGPMHVAAALGVRVYAVFGPTSPVRTGPYGPGHVVIKTGLPCAPCYKRECPEARCMDAVSAKEVLDVIIRNEAGLQG